MIVHVDEMETPVGRILLATRGATLVAVEMEEAKQRSSWSTGDRPGIKGRFRARLSARFADATFESARAGSVRRALERYFQGDVDALDSLAVDPGGTGFEANVWALLRKILAGRTTTYGEIAARAGRPGAARAAGRAVGSNPIPIVIPCHRVVGRDGSLTGFGGGLPRKLWLLEHEGAILV